MTSLAASPTTPPKLTDGLGELLRLAWPVVMSRIGVVVMGLTDAIVVGRFSAKELGYQALGWAPTGVVLTTAVGLLAGVQIMTARRIGEGRLDAVGAVLRRGVVYSVWVGLASLLVLALIGPPFMHASGLEPDLADGATKVLMVFALSLPFYLVSTAGSLFLEAIGKPKLSMVVMWLANGVNLIFNLWLVPGNSGFPVEGAVASAWATSIARVFLFVGVFVCIALSPRARSFGVFSTPVNEPGAAAEQRRVGYASGASFFIESSAFSAMTLFAGGIGGLQAAAWSLVMNLTSLIFMAPLGLGAATAVLVSRAYGAKDRHAVVQAGKLGLAVTLALTMTVCVVMWPGAPWVARAYTADPALIALAVPAIVLGCLFFAVDGLQTVAAQALRARADIWWPTVFHLFSYSAVMLPLGWVLARTFGWGVNGLVWAVIIASFLSATLLCGRFLLLARRPV
jgi:MATE family multidrug resistance protein